MDNEIKNINHILGSATNKIEGHDKTIIDDTISLIKELQKSFGPAFFLAYINAEEKYIGIHRDNCEYFKHFTKESKAKFKKYKTYSEAQKSGLSLCNKIQTDINSHCPERRPELNLQAILKSINNIFFNK